jgi:hypothetical protein
MTPATPACALLALLGLAAFLEGAAAQALPAGGRQSAAEAAQGRVQSLARQRFLLRGEQGSATGTAALQQGLPGPGDLAGVPGVAEDEAAVALALPSASGESQNPGKTLEASLSASSASLRGPEEAAGAGADLSLGNGLDALEAEHEQLAAELATEFIAARERKEHRGDAEGRPKMSRTMLKRAFKVYLNEVGN